MVNEVMWGKAKMEIPYLAPTFFLPIMIYHHEKLSFYMGRTGML